MNTGSLHRRPKRAFFFLLFFSAAHVSISAASLVLFGTRVHFTNRLSRLDRGVILHLRVRHTYLSSRQVKLFCITMRHC